MYFAEEKETDEAKAEADGRETRRHHVAASAAAPVCSVAHSPMAPMASPSIASVMADAFNITQDRIMRSRLAGDPPDVLITARMNKIGLFEFHRADELIALGREAARRAIDDIREHIDLEPPAQALPAPPSQAEAR